MTFFDDHSFSALIPLAGGIPSILTSHPSDCYLLISLHCCRCFTLLLLAILLLESPHDVPVGHLDSIKEHMTTFLDQTQSSLACQYEKERGTIWATLLPYVKLVFLPETPRNFPECPSLTELQVLSLKVVLFFLHSKMAVERYHSLLRKEELVDFVLCMPWHVPNACRGEASAVASDLSTAMGGPQPPRLLSLAQAKLAKSSIGLERVRGMSAGKIRAFFYPY